MKFTKNIEIRKKSLFSVVWCEFCVPLIRQIRVLVLPVLCISGLHNFLEPFFVNLKSNPWPFSPTENKKIRVLYDENIEMNWFEHGFQWLGVQNVLNKADSYMNHIQRRDVQKSKYKMTSQVYVTKWPIKFDYVIF